MLTFSDLDLIAPLQRAVAAENYTEPTAIQAKAIPPLLAGRDVLGCAQTGTGKTAAFALPVLQHLSNDGVSGKRRIRALVLSPTRELAAQIGERFGAYGRFVGTVPLVIFGGVSEKPQISALRRGVDVLVATPGRLLDLLGRNFIDLSNVEFFVLDEADRMLDMGFIRDIRRVLQYLPSERQNLLFSATMPSTIEKLAGTILNRPIRVDATPPSSTVERIDQCVYFVGKRQKKHLLGTLLNKIEWERALIFTRTKHGANRLTTQLERYGIDAMAIHGNKSQNARDRAMNGFRDGSLKVLIATDIASRGIDVNNISHVFNYDLTNEPEVYIHRIGRTGRAGASGTAISFCDGEERPYLRAIERLIGFKIDVATEHQSFDDNEPNPIAPRESTARGQGRSGNRSPRASEPSRQHSRPRRSSNDASHGERASAEPARENRDASGSDDRASDRPVRRRRRRRRANGPSPGGNTTISATNSSARTDGQADRSPHRHGDSGGRSEQEQARSNRARTPGTQALDTNAPPRRRRRTSGNPSDA